MERSNNFSTEYWKETESRVEFIPKSPPSSLKITAVKMYATKDDQLLLARVDRGWDLPGGHVEEDETPDEALVRELKEEAGATVRDYEKVGYLRITNLVENENNKNYPKQSGILLYKGTDIYIDHNYNLSQFESSEQRFIPFAEVPNHHHNWSKLKQEILEYIIH